MKNMNAVWESLDVPVVPVIEIGVTEYLESVKMTAPVMKGVDKANRRFIAISARHEAIWGRGCETEIDPDCVVILFQRYTGDPGFWVVSGIDNTAAFCAANNAPLPDVSKILHFLKGQPVESELYGEKHKYELSTK